MEVDKAVALMQKHDQAVVRLVKSRKAYAPSLEATYTKTGTAVLTELIGRKPTEQEMEAVLRW